MGEEDSIFKNNMLGERMCSREHAACPKMKTGIKSKSRCLVLKCGSKTAVFS